MKKGTLSIHSENILPIIKKWLYSEKDIFLRELVANASDAIQKIKLLIASSQTQAGEKDFRIDITIDKDKKILSIEDNGIGMTSEEVEKYIAQIAFSGAEDFLKKYKSKNEKDQIIGHFGLGFFSSYMVAKKVEIETLSHEKNAKAVFWSCDGTTEYTIEKSDRNKVGTKVILHIDKNNEEFLDENKVKKILLRYCPYLPFAIYLNNNHINNKDPLYLKAPSKCKDSDYLQFYKELYPFESDPLFWIHLNVDFPFHLKGILYFPKITSQFDINKSKIKLFCNRVFVSDNCKDLLPDFLMVLKGAIDSPDIPLNVSRSFLQMDTTVKSLGQHISKKISDRLFSFYINEREKFISAWKDIEVIIKLGILQDEKFYDRVKKFLIWKNSNDEWTTLEEYISRNKDKNKEKIFYTHEESKSYLSLYKEKGYEVLHFHPYFDSSLAHILETKLSCKFQRIDSSIEEDLIDSSKEKDLLDKDGKSERVKMAEFFQSCLSINDLKVEAKSLVSSSIFGLIQISEEQRRFKDYLKMTNNDQAIPLEETFVINTSNKIIEKTYQLKGKNPDLAKKIANQIYGLARLSQKSLSDKDLEDFISTSQNVLEKLL